MRRVIVAIVPPDYEYEIGPGTEVLVEWFDDGVGPIREPSVAFRPEAKAQLTWGAPIPGEVR